MEEQSRMVRGIYEAFGRGDMPAVLGALADDVAWHEAEGMPYGGLHRGPAAVAENVFARVIEDIPDFAVVLEELIAAGDTVVVVARYTGLAKATGKSLDLPVAHVWDVRDGKVARFRQFVDTAKFLEAVPAEISASA